MIRRREWLRMATAAVMLCGNTAFSQNDPGKASIGRVSVSVYYATDGDPKVAGAKAA